MSQALIQGNQRFRILRRLGEGAFGTVYLAESLGGLSRQVAIKVLHPEKRAMAARLRDEARILSFVRHRSIVRVEDLITLDGHPAMVMEYVEGVDLGQVIQQGPLPWRSAAAIAMEVARALHAAWVQQGPSGPLHLLHRDIKPANIRLTRNGEVRLLDFGVAHANFASKEASLTQGSMGTLSYMAPERFENQDSTAGDVYALGVTLFEMLIGELPGSTAMSVDRLPPGRALRDAWAMLSRSNPSLFKLIVCMLSKDPADRPEAREVADTLENLLSELPGSNLNAWAENLPLSSTPAPGLRPDLSGTIVRASLPESAAPKAIASSLWVGGAFLMCVVCAGGVMGGGVLAFLGWDDAPSAEIAPSSPPAEVVPVVSTPLVAPPVTPVKPSVVTPPVVTAPSVKPPVASIPKETVVPPTKVDPPVSPVVEVAPATGSARLEGIATVQLSGPSGLRGNGNLSNLLPGTYVLSYQNTSGDWVQARGVAVVEAGKVTVIACASIGCAARPPM